MSRVFKSAVAGLLYVSEVVVCEAPTWDLHFLSSADDMDPLEVSTEANNNCEKDSSGSDQRPLSKQELLEYVVQRDGSVICKWCGESVPSRTHWYRHKYRLHAINLFRCGKCFVYFKTKKGYLGHINNSHKGGWKKWRHSDSTVRAEPVAPKKVPTEPPTLRKRQKQTDWAGEQENEEKLIADIIERVKREFEAQTDNVPSAGQKEQSYCRRRQVSSQ